MALLSRLTDPRAVLWAGEGLRVLLGFALLKLLSHAAGAEQMGRYLAIVSIAMLMPRVLDLGVPQALSYFLRLHPGGGRPLAGLLLRHAALAGMAALCIGYAMRFFPYASPAVTALARDSWLPVALLVWSELTALLGLSTFIPSGRYAAHVATTLTPPLVFMALLGACWQGGAALPADRLVELFVLASLAGAAVMAAACVRGLRGQAAASWPALPLYRYGLQSYGTGLAKITAQRFDRLFLAAVLGAAGYAQYSLAVSMRDIVVFPANLFALTLKNRQVDLVVRHGDVAGARRELGRASLAWLAWGLAVAALLYPLWPWLVERIFGPAFAQTAEFMRVLAFSCGPLATLGLAWNHLYALHRPARVTAVTVGSLLLSVPVFLGCIAWLGPTLGAAVASVGCAAATAAVSFHLAMAASDGAPARPGGQGAMAE